MIARANLVTVCRPAMKLAILSGLMVAAALAVPFPSGNESVMQESFYPGINATLSSSPQAITGFDFLPKALSIDEGAEMVTIKVNVSGWRRDIQSVEVLFVGPSGNQSKRILMNGSNLISEQSGGSREINDAEGSPGGSQSYAGRIYFSSASQKGNWSLQQLMVCDNSSLCMSLDGEAAKSLGYPVTLQISKAETESDIGRENDIEDRQGAVYDQDQYYIDGWANSNELFLASRNILINSAFNRPVHCGT